MTINITTTDVAAQEKIHMLFYGEGGIGKTTLVTTLPVSDDSKLLYIAADPGQLALRNRKFHIIRAPQGEWSTTFLMEVYEYVRHNANKYEWVVIDGIDDLGDAVKRAKMKNQRDGRKAYGEMAEFMEEWIKMMRDINGVSTIMITHIDSDKDESTRLFFPMFPGQMVTKRLIDWFDLVGCMRLIRTGENTTERLIQFKPEQDPRFRVKDRSGVLGLTESPNLGSIIAKIRESGFIITDEFKNPISDDTVEAIKKEAKEKYMKLAQVTSIATSIFGRNVSNLTEEQGQKLLAKIKSN